MTSPVIALILILLAIFLFVQIIIARGWHSYLVTQADNVEATQRLRKFVRWFLFLGFIAWLIALVVMPDKSDAAVVGGGTLVLVGGALVLPLLARMERISGRTYVAARILIVPLLGGLVIFLSEVLR